MFEALPLPAGEHALLREERGRPGAVAEEQAAAAAAGAATAPAPPVDALAMRLSKEALEALLQTSTTTSGSGTTSAAQRAAAAGGTSESAVGPASGLSIEFCDERTGVLCVAGTSFRMKLGQRHEGVECLKQSPGAGGVGGTGATDGAAGAGGRCRVVLVPVGEVRQSCTVEPTTIQGAQARLARVETARRESTTATRIVSSDGGRATDATTPRQPRRRRGLVLSTAKPGTASPRSQSRRGSAGRAAAPMPDLVLPSRAPRPASASAVAQTSVSVAEPSQAARQSKRRRTEPAPPSVARAPHPARGGGDTATRSHTPDDDQHMSSSSSSEEEEEAVAQRRRVRAGAQQRVRPGRKRLSVGSTPAQTLGTLPADPKPAASPVVQGGEDVGADKLTPTPSIAARRRASTRGRGGASRAGQQQQRPVRGAPQAERGLDNVQEETYLEMRTTLHAILAEFKALGDAVLEAEAAGDAERAHALRERLSIRHRDCSQVYEALHKACEAHARSKAAGDGRE